MGSFEPADFIAEKLSVDVGTRTYEGDNLPHGKVTYLSGDNLVPFKLKFPHIVQTSSVIKGKFDKGSFRSIKITIAPHFEMRKMPVEVPEAEDSIKFLKESFIPQVYDLITDPKTMAGLKLKGIKRTDPTHKEDFIEKFLNTEPDGSVSFYASVSCANLPGKDYGRYLVLDPGGNEIKPFSIMESYSMLGLTDSIVFEVKVKSGVPRLTARLYGLVMSNMEKSNGKIDQKQLDKAQSFMAPDLGDILAMAAMEPPTESLGLPEGEGSSDGEEGTETKVPAGWGSGLKPINPADAIADD